MSLKTTTTNKGDIDFLRRKLTFYITLIGHVKFEKKVILYSLENMSDYLMIFFFRYCTFNTNMNYKIFSFVVLPTPVV